MQLQPQHLCTSLVFSGLLSVHCGWMHKASASNSYNAHQCHQCRLCVHVDMCADRCIQGCSAEPKSIQQMTRHASNKIQAVLQSSNCSHLPMRMHKRPALLVPDNLHILVAPGGLAWWELQPTAPCTHGKWGAHGSQGNQCGVNHSFLVWREWSLGRSPNV